MATTPFNPRTARLPHVEFRQKLEALKHEEGVALPGGTTVVRGSHGYSVRGANGRVLHSGVHVLSAAASALASDRLARRVSNR